MVYVHKTVTNITIPVGDSELQFEQSKDDKRAIEGGARTWVIQADPMVESLILSQVHFSSNNERDVPMTFDEEENAKVATRQAAVKQAEAISAFTQVAIANAIGTAPAKV